MATSVGGLTASVTAQFEPTVTQLATAGSGDANALRQAAETMSRIGTDVTEVHSRAEADGRQLGDWSGKARQTFDAGLVAELRRVESSGAGVAKFADAMRVLAEAMAQANTRGAEIRLRFKLNSLWLRAMETISVSNQSEAVALAQRNGENAVAAGQEMVKELEARLVEFIAAIRSVAGTSEAAPSGANPTGTHKAEWVAFLKDSMKKYGITDLDEQAYILASVEHETDGFRRMREKYNGPSREDYFENKYGYQTTTGGILGNTEPGDGARYAGTGMVQLTGRWNFNNFGIADTPEMAADPATAADIAVRGMRDGMFRSGHSLGDYHLANGGYDFYNARDIVNGGHDQATHIADLAKKWREQLGQE